MENTDDFVEKFKEALKSISLPDDKREEVKSAMQELGYTEKEATDLCSSAHSYLFKIKDTGRNIRDITLKLDFLVKVFGSVEKFLKFESAQSYIDTIMDITERKYTIYDMPLEEVTDKLQTLMQIFSMTKEEVIEKICKRPDWFFHKASYFEKKFDGLQEFFGKDRAEVVGVCADFPTLLGKRLNHLQSNVEQICEHFQWEESDLKALMWTYPGLANWSAWQFKQHDFDKRLFEKPWLLELLLGSKTYNYGGYATFNDLCTYIEYIEGLFGKKERLIKVRFKDFVAQAVALRNQAGEKFVVSIGANHMTEKGRNSVSMKDRLLASIFGEKSPKYSMNEYFCKLNKQYEEEIYVTTIFGLIGERYSCRADFKPESEICKKPIDIISTDGIDEYVDAEFDLDDAAFTLILKAPYFEEKAKLRAYSSAKQRERSEKFWTEHRRRAESKGSDSTEDDDLDSLFDLDDLFGDDDTDNDDNQ